MGSVGVSLDPMQISVMTTRYWGAAGVHKTVGFMESINSDLRSRILSHFNAWGEFCNVKFVHSTTDPDVRVTREGNGYWSYVGTDNEHIDKNEPTMCLEKFSMQHPESEFRRVIRHEVGHYLGCPHEHMRSQIINRMNYEKTIAYFRQEQGWSRQDVIRQVLTPLAESSLMGTNDADETSIMAYSLPGFLTNDGKPIVGGDDFAPQDKAFMAKIYPLPVTPQPPVISDSIRSPSKVVVFDQFGDEMAAMMKM